MKFSTIKDILLIVLILVVGILFNMGGKVSEELKLKEKELSQQKIKYANIILAEKEVRKKEAELRQKEREKDSILIHELRYFKTQDSLKHIREIRIIIKELKKYNEPQIDSILIKAYEDAIYSHP